MSVLGQSAAHRVISRKQSRNSSAMGFEYTLSWGFSTDVGHRRSHNEDSLLAIPPVFAVADGMGGHSAGDVASAAVVTRLSELARKGANRRIDFTTPEEVLDALRAATVDISHASDDEHLGVGTTVTGAALTLHGGRPYWAVFNVGDSRTYLFKDKVLARVSVDHSVVQELVDAGLIGESDAEAHPDANVITRAVGFNADPVPDFWAVPVTANSRLLLCSDGLTREVSDSRIRLHLAAGLTPQETVLALLDAALASGGRDNVTALVIDVAAAAGSTS